VGDDADKRKHGFSPNRVRRVGVQRFRKASNQRCPLACGRNRP
jgi:hypothetical protein